MNRQVLAAVAAACGLAAAPGCGDKKSAEPTAAAALSPESEAKRKAYENVKTNPGAYAEAMRGKMGGGGGPPAGADAPAPVDLDLPVPPPAGKVQFPVGSVRVAAARLISENNLKQIMLAMHAHHDTFGFFPAGIYDASGQKPGLGWRVAILPFLDEDALYKQFKLDEPWDGPNNKKLIGKMPKAFGVNGSDLADGLTYYRAVIGKDAALTLPPAGQPGAPAPGGKMTAITDGTSNTAVIVEAADPVVWTRPDRLDFELDKPLPKLGGLFGDSIHVGMGDGRVRRIPKSTDEKVIRAMLSGRGGEVVELP